MLLTLYHILIRFVLLNLLLTPFTVTPSRETQTLSRFDDPAIWIHPTTPSQSLIIGANKNWGIYSYNLDGTLQQHVTPLSGKTQYNNVDIRYGFPLNGERIDIAVVTQRTSTPYTLDIYKINPTTRQLTDITGATGLAGIEPYGLGLYHDPASDKFYAFVTSGNSPHHVRQFELTDGGNGKVNTTLVRTITNVTNLAEGVVADDVKGVVYISQEDEGIFKYEAAPTAVQTRTTVALVGSNGLTADVEGLAIYPTIPSHCNGSSGYLIASSQGNATFHLFSRDGDNAFLNAFAVGDNAAAGVDGLSGTDGIDVTNVALGPLFPNGFFIGHDDVDTDPDGQDHENFKMVAWENLATGGNLCVDTSWHPRLTSAAATLHDDNGLVLDWEDSNPSSCYAIHRSPSPYFTPSAGTLQQVLPHATGRPYPLANQPGYRNTAVNHYYQLLAQNCDGSLPQTSNTVGEFDFALTPGN